MKISDKYIYFWGEWPSNWFPCFFTINYEGKEYKFYNSEQYFMFVKAKTFGDEEIAKEIVLKGKNPKTAKALGRKVKNYDDNVWNEKRYEVMLEACYQKFSQSKILKKLILNEEFNGKGFVEASIYDKIWGIGISENEALDDQSNWNGQNLLGKVLDEVRNKLKDD